MPWPPMPVMRTSRSICMAPSLRHPWLHCVRTVGSHSCKTEGNKIVDFAAFRLPSVRDRVVHPREHEIRDERRGLTVAAERMHGGVEGVDELGASIREVGGKAVGEPGAVDREGTGCVGGGLIP